MVRPARTQDRNQLLGFIDNVLKIAVIQMALGQLA
jgi:hypothetical protein